MNVYGVYVVVMKVTPMGFTTFNVEGPYQGPFLLTRARAAKR